MVELVARQSVILKCSMNASILLGNYEYYYAAGLFCGMLGIAPKEDILPGELEAFLKPRLTSYQGDGERELYLVKLLSGYKPKEEYDKQMKELLQWGLRETELWQVNEKRGKDFGERKTDQPAESGGAKGI